MSLDFTGLDAVLDVGFDPIFDVAMQFRVAMNQRDARAVPPEFKRGDGGRILAANDGDVEPIKRMRIVVVVVNLAERFAGDAHPVGQVVVAGRDNQFGGLKCGRATEAIGHPDGEVAIGAADLVNALILPDLKFVERRYLPVILKSFVARWLGICARERDAADLKQFRRGEEGHVRRIVEERIADAAFVNQNDTQTGFLRFNGAGEPGGTGSNNEQVVRILLRYGGLRCDVVHSPRLGHSADPVRMAQRPASESCTKAARANPAYNPLT